MFVARMFAALLASLMVVGSASAQHSLPFVAGEASSYSFPLLRSYPPLSERMPRDVIRGYIELDSLARYAERMEMERMFSGLAYSDTARFTAKYLYKLADYDPVLFYQWLSTSPQRAAYRTAPAYIRKRLAGSFGAIAPELSCATPLLASDVILHVTVGDVQARVDSTAMLARSAQIVTATVVDPIKGGRLLLGRPGGSAVSIRPISNRSTSPSPRVRFEYRLEWRRLNHAAIFGTTDSTLVDADGRPWVKPNGEYIVFLRFLNLGRDATSNYAALVPVTGWGTMACMYPVVNGRVYDPYNDFGFGSNLTVEQFKTALRGSIASLIHP